MSDVPFVREIGRVRDVFGGSLIVGVELNTVTLSYEPDLKVQVAGYASGLGTPVTPPADMLAPGGAP